MHDCCIRVTALLEYFKVSNTAGQKAKGVVFLCLFFIHASGLGRLLIQISYLGSIIKGRVTPHSIIMIGIDKWAWLSCFYNQD